MNRLSLPTPMECYHGGNGLEETWKREVHGRERQDVHQQFAQGREACMKDRRKPR